MEKNWIIGDKYLVIEKVGTGGFATVYKAWDMFLKKFVAVKKIHEEFSRDARFVDMFRDEAVNTAKLEHENIVRVISLITDENDNFYIIMDYVKGVDLEYLMKKCGKQSKKIPPDIAVYIISEIIKALDYAHSVKDELTGKPLNIVHQDISPGNIMLYFDGRIKLTDFGIAKAESTQLDTPEKGKLTGKISYMSPEQAQQRDDIDSRSDIFSCGLILYEMLTGRKAYEGESRIDSWKKAKSAKIDFDEIENSDISTQVKEILKKALEKDPEKRYQNTAEVFLDLKRYLSKKGTRREQQERYKEFLKEILEEEIKKAEQKAESDSKKDFKALKKDADKINSKENLGKPDSKEYDKEKKEVEQKNISDEKEKTVFDFVLDTAKRYKKIFISILISLASAFVIFTVLDTYFQLTDYGTKIHNLIWPPALEIDTFPSNSAIEIFSQKGTDIIEENGYNSRTPSYIEKIQPGVYSLVLSKRGYGEMRRTLTVYGKKKGEQNISVAGAKIINGRHVVPFEVALDIDSVPDNAKLFIDDKRVGETPFKGTVEIGPHNIYLESQGFEMLGSRNPDIGDSVGVCLIDTSKPIDEQRKIDFRFWDIKVGKDENGKKLFSITGTMWKKIQVLSEPPGAAVFVEEKDKESKPEKVSRGTTPLEDIILKAGEYIIRLEKEGFEKYTETINIHSESKEKIYARLKKILRIYAYRKGGNWKDIGANVQIKGTGIRGRTPLKVALPFGKYTFSFTKDPAYKSASVTKDIKDVKNRLSVLMEMRLPHLYLKVTDYHTGKGIERASIWINGSYWKRTNSAGIASGYIDQPPGEFKIQIKSDEYDEYKTAVEIAKGKRKRMEVELGTPRDGTVKFDVPKDLSGISIYMDGEYIGEESHIIADVTRTKHHIEIRNEKTGETTQKKIIELTKPNEIISLTVQSYGSRLSLEEKNLPYFKIKAKRFKNNNAIESAKIWINDTLWKKTNENGEAFGSVEVSTGTWIVTIEAKGYKYLNTAAVSVKRNTSKELEIELGGPRDGTVVFDIPEEFYNSSIYIDKEYAGKAENMISEISRNKHLIEIRSDKLNNEVSTVVEFDETNQLIVLKLVLKEGEAYLEEVNPEEYLAK